MVVPGMSDGRAFTSYESSCVLNKEIMDHKNLTPAEYRKYLQDNAVQLIQSTLNIQSNLASYECR